MPNDISINVGVILDTNDVQKQLDELKNNKTNKITISVDAQKITQQVNDIKKSIQTKTPAKIVLDVLKGQSNSNIDSYIKEVQEKYKNSPIKLTLGIDDKTTSANIKNAMSGMLQEIQKQMTQTTQQVTQQMAQQATQAAQQAAQAAQQAAQAASQKVTHGQNTAVGGQVGNVPIPTNVAQSTKYVDQLTEAVERYQTAFADASASVSRWSVNNGTSAAIEFKNALGEVTTVMFRLQELEDGMGNKLTDALTGDTIKEWVPVGDRFSKSFKDASQEIQKTLDELQRLQAQLDSIKTRAATTLGDQNGMYRTLFNDKADPIQKKIMDLTDAATNKNITITTEQVRELRQELSELSNTRTTLQFERKQSISEQLQLDKSLNEVQKLQNALNELKAKAFDRGNQLTGNFAKPVEDEVKRIQDLLDSIRSNASTKNLSQTTKEISDVSQALKELDLLRKNQQNKQYQARQLSATDIEKQIPILTNEVAILENKLKSVGFGDQFKTQIQELRDMLSTLGKEGGTTAQQFNSAMRKIKSEVDLLNSTPQGKGISKAYDISQDQLQSIEHIRDILSAQPNTAGIQDLLRQLDELEGKYQNLQTGLQNPVISEDLLSFYGQSEAELDKQLSVFQNFAQKLGTDIASQGWLEQQEAGIANLRKQIEEYQQQLKSTIELPPELKGRLDAFVSGSNAIDIANLDQYKNSFRELVAEIERFKNSTRGQASQLSMSIDDTQLRQIQNIYDTLNNLDSQYSGTGVENLKNNLQALATEYQNVMTQLQSSSLTQTQFEELSRRVQELDKQLKQAADTAKIFEGGIKNDAALRKFEQSAEALRLKFEQLQRTYADLIRSNPQIASSFSNVENQINNVDPTNIQEVSRAVNNLGKECQITTGQSAGLRGALQDAFGGLGSYISRFTSAYFIVSKTIQAIKNMSNTVKEVNSSIVELQKVTDLTGNSLDSFVDKAYKVGSTLGRTGQDVIDATTTFSRAGYDLQQATDLAQSALVMTNIGVDIPSTESAVSDMISILKAFDIQAEESMGVIDKLYNVANKEPLDFGNITEMLVTAGGTLAQTGTSLEETMGLLTGAFATMRDTSVANGLIMISQRLRGVKEDGEAIEEEGFMPKLKNLFGSVGISIEDQNGELRSTYDILNDLASVWDLLSSKQKQYFGEKVAGNRQVKTLNAIMQNWDVVADTIEKADTAQGKALEGNEMYMNSVAGKMTQLKSAMQELSTTTINSDFLGFFADIGTGIVKLLTNMGGLVPLLTTITGLIVVIKGQQIAKGIGAIATAFTGLFKGMGGGLSVMTGWVGLAVAVAGAVMTVVSYMNNAKKSFQDFQQATSDSKKELSEEQSKLESLNSELEDTKRLISELEGKDSLTVVEEDELGRLKERNAELENEIKLEKALIEIRERGARKAAVEEYSSYGDQKGSAKEKYKNIYSYMDGNDTLDNELEYAKSNILLARGLMLAAKEELATLDVDSLTESEKLQFENDSEAFVAKYDEIESVVSERISYLDSLIGDLSKVEPDESGYISESDKAFNALFDERKELADLLLEARSMGAAIDVQYNAIAQKYPEVLQRIDDEMAQEGKGWEIRLSTDDAVTGVNNLIDSLKDLEEEEAKSKLKEYLYDTFADPYKSGSGNITNLLDRKAISGKDMFEAGWEEFKDNLEDVVTYYSSSYTETIGDVPIAFTMTPVGPDGKAYSPDELDQYVSDLLDSSTSITDFYMNDLNQNKLLVHYTVALDGDIDEAEATEGLYGQILHYISGAIDGEDSIQSAIDGLVATVSFDNMIRELSTKLQKSEEEIQRMLIGMFAPDTSDVKEVLSTSVSEIGEKLFSSSNTKNISETAANYKNLTAAIAEQQKAGALSYETWSKLTSDGGPANINDYLRLTADGYKLDTDALYEYIDAQNKELDLDIAEAIMERQIKIDEYRKAIEETLDPLEDLAEIEDKQTQIDAWENEINQLKAVSLEAHNATGALQQFRDAVKSQDQDSEHEEGKNIAKTVAKRFEEGKVGTDDFKKGMGFLLGENWLEDYENDLNKAFDAASKISEKYFGEEDETSAQNFAETLAATTINGQKVAEYDAATGQLTMLQNEATGAAFTIQELADALGMSEDAVESLFGLLNSYSLTDQFEFDRPIASTEQLAVAMERLKEKEDAVKRAEDELSKLEPGTTDYDEKEKELEGLKTEAAEAEQSVSTLNEAIESGGEVNPFASLDDLNTKLENVQNAIKWLNENGITVPVELEGQHVKLQSLVARLEQNKNPQVNVTAKDNGATDTVDKVEKKVKELNGNKGKGTAEIDANANDFNTVETKVENDIKRLKGDDGKVETRFGGVDDGYANASEIVKDDVKSINGKEGNATAHFDGDAEAFNKIAGDVEKDSNDLDGNEYIIDFTATDNNTINAIGEAADAVVTKPRTIKFGVKYENGKVRPAEEGEEPDNIFTDNTWTDKKGQTRGFSGVYPYQTRGSDAITRTKTGSSNGFVNYLNKMAGDQGFTSEASAEAIELYNKKVEESIKAVEQETQAREDSTEEMVSWPQQAWQEGASEIEVDSVPLTAENLIVEKGFEGEKAPSALFEENKPAEAPVKVPVEVAIAPKSTSNDEFGQTWMDAFDPDKLLDDWGVQEPIKVPVEVLPDPEVVVEEYQGTWEDIFGGSETQESLVESYNEAKEKIGEDPIDVKLDVDTETVTDDIKKVDFRISKDDIDSLEWFSKNLVKIANGYDDIDTSSVEELQSAMSELSTAYENISNVDINDTSALDSAATDLYSAADNFSAAYSALSEQIKKKQSINVSANVDNAIKKIKGLSDIKIKVDVDANVNTNQQNAKGTSHAKAGMSLVDEEGAELIEHTSDGTFELGTNNGPRFTQLNKGDVVHTADETKKILSRTGNIGSFFRDGLNQDKSIIGGAYADGLWKKIVGGANTLVSGAVNLFSSKKNTTKKKSSKKKGNGSNNKPDSGFKDWVEKLFDWAEVKLTRLQEATDSWVTKATNAIGSVFKNENLGNAMQSVNSQIEATTQAYQLYIKQAEEVAKKGNLSADIIQKIKDGTIEIGQYDKNVQEVIKEYQEWYNKAVDCNKALTELAETQKELTEQRLQNIVEDYGNRASIYQKEINTHKSAMDMSKALGRRVNGAGEYSWLEGGQYGDFSYLIQQEENTLNAIAQERDSLRAEFNNLVGAGLVVEGDDTWYKYYNQLQEFDAEIYNVRTRIADLKDEAHNVNLQNMSYQLEEISDSAAKLNDEMEIAVAQGSVSVTGTKKYHDQVAQSIIKQNNALEEQNNYYKRLQKGMDVNSEKYQEFEKKIRSNEKAMRDNNKEYEKYLDTIRQINIAEKEYSLKQLTNEAEDIGYTMDMKQLTGTTGKENSDTIKLYRELQKNADSQKKNYNSQIATYQAGMRDMVAQYGTEAMSSQKYRDMESAVRDLQKAVNDLDKAQVQWDHDVQNTKTETLGYKIENITSKIDEYNDQISFKQATGNYVNAGDYKNLIIYSLQSVEAIKRQNQAYREQQKGMDKLSPAYQEIEKKIRSNNSAINDSYITIQGYKDAINQIKIDKYAHKLDLLTAAQDEYNYSIKDAEVSGKEIFSKQYKDLISNGNSQIKTLTGERDMYKSLMDAIVETYGTAAKESDKYKEYESRYISLNKEIRDTTLSIKDYNKAISDLKTEKIGWSADAANAGIDETNNQIALMKATGQYGGGIVSKENNKLINQSREAIKYLENQNREYRNQQKGMDVMSSAYQELEGKIRSNNSAISNLSVSIEEYKDNINNVKIDSYAHKLDLLTAEQEKYNYAIKNAEVSGKEIFSKQYNNLIKNGNKQIGNLTTQRDAYKSLMDAMVKTYGASAKESDKYKEYESQYLSLDTQIRDTTISIKEWQKAISDLKIEKLGWAADASAASIEKVQDRISLYEAQGRYVDANNYNSMIKESNAQISKLEKQNKAYLEQRKGMDKNSAAYQELEGKIRSNNSTINELRISMEQYKDSINQIQFDKLSHAFDNLTAQQESYNDAIKLRETTGKEIFESSYKSLIKNGNNQIKNLTSQRNAYKALMDALVKTYGTSAKETEKYKKYESSFLDLENQIRDTTIAVKEWEKAIYDLRVEKVGYSIDRVSASIKTLEDSMSLNTATGKFTGSDYYNKLIKYSQQQVKYLNEQNKIYKQQQKGMNANSAAYQDLENKIRSNNSAINELNISMQNYKDSIKQISLDKYSHAFDNLTAQQESYNDAIKLRETIGKEITGKYYNNLINNGNKQITNLNNQKNAYKALMDAIVKSYGASAKESDKYKEYEKQFHSLENQIRDTTISIKEWDKQVSNLSIEKLGWRMGNAEYAIKSKQDAIAIRNARGQAMYASIYNEMIAESRKEINYLTKQNDLFRKQQKGMDVYSAAYQDLLSKIRSNNAAINELNISIQEYQDSINQISLNKYEHALDKLTAQQEKYNDAIKSRETIGKEITGNYYRNLINNGNKQITNLTNQKNLYKSLMDTIVKAYGTSAKESEKYKDYEKQFLNLEDQIRDTTVAVKEWERAISNINVDLIGWKMGTVEYTLQSKQDAIAVRNARGQSMYTSIYNEMIEQNEKQISFLRQQNDLYRKQQKGMDVYSAAYQELLNKIRSNNHAINELTISTEEYKDAINKISFDKYQHALDILVNDANKLDYAIKEREAKGKEIISSYYKNLINNGNKQITNLKNQKKAYEDLMATLVSLYGTSAKESDKYKEYEKEVNSLDSSIRDLNLSIIDWNKAIKELEIEKLTWQLDSLTASVDRVNASMSLHAAQGVDETSAAYKKLINNGMEQIKVLEKENALYVEQQKNMDKNSTAYQEIQGKINSNLSTIEDIKVKQEEWNDAIIDLGINNIQKYRDALSRTNEEYNRQKELQESIQELEKIATQRKIRTYVEGEGFVYQSDAEELKSAQEKLEEVISNQLMDRLDDLIDALEESKKDTNVYDANGKLLGQVYNTPNIGTLTDILSSYANKNIPVISVDVLKDSLGKKFATSVGNASTNNNTSLNIGDIIINEARDGNALAQAIVEQFPNALLQALYKKQ